MFVSSSTRAWNALHILSKVPSIVLDAYKRSECYLVVPK